LRAGAQTPSADRDDLFISGEPEAPSWWSVPGRPGYMPDMAWGIGYPWTLMGHYRGAWTLEDPHLEETGPLPDLRVPTPIGWSDSLAIETGGNGAWSGFEGSLATARLVPVRLTRRDGSKVRAIADLNLTSGSSAYDGNALSVVRGDSANWVRAAATSWTRGGYGTLGTAGRHQFDVADRWASGRHHLQAVLSETGWADGMEGSVEESSAGAGGSLGYGVDLSGATLNAAFARGYDHRETFGDFITYSRRDAHQRRVMFEAEAPSQTWGAHVEVRDEQVNRVTEGLPETDADANSVWAAGRIAKQRGPARIEASLGAGRHGGVRRTELAPTFVFRFAQSGWVSRTYVERVLAPVWTDLAYQQSPFLQQTWLGGFDLGHIGTTTRARFGWIMGRTHDRALVDPYPLQDLWLRFGYRRDPNVYDFGMATASGDWGGRRWAAHGELYQLFRDSQSATETFDPRRGGRFGLETHFRAFQGDLGVRLRGEMELFGGRPNAIDHFVWVPGDATYGASVLLTLLDANVTVRFQNLENKRRPLPWQDPITGQEGMSEGFGFRLALNWRLYN
jgi:hypothetical protein